MCGRYALYYHAVPQAVGSPKNDTPELVQPEGSGQRMTRLTLALVAISAVGILGAIFDDYFAGVYAFFALLLLMGVQLSAMARGNLGGCFGAATRARY